MPTETPTKTELTLTLEPHAGHPSVADGCVTYHRFAANCSVLATAVEEDDEQDEDEPEEDEDDLDEVEDDEDEEEYDDDDADDQDDDVVIEDDEADEDDEDGETEDDDSASVKKLMTEPPRPAARHTIH